MSLSIFKNQSILVLFAMALSLSIFTSCEKDEVDVTINVVNVYNGTFNADGFASVDYDVTVTKVDNKTVKIEPQDSNGTSFEIGIVGDNGTYIDVTGQIVFAKDSDGVKTFVFNKDGEQFAGKEK